MTFVKTGIFSTFIALIILLSSCKDKNTTEPVNNNTGNSNAPALQSPANNLTIYDQNPLLDWTDFTGAVSYRVQVSLDANFQGTMILDSSSISASQVRMPGAILSQAVYYYWRVQAFVSAQSTSDWSAVWRFRPLTSPPSAPNPVAPVNNAGNQSFMPFFDWDDAATAQFYRLQVSTVPDFATWIYDTSGVPVSQVQTPYGKLTTGTQYYWRVNASNSNGISTSPWSTIFNFTTASGPAPGSISGRITFADTNFTLPIETRYVIAAYDAWPPTLNYPIKFDTLSVQQNSGVYFADYSLTGFNNGAYRLAVYYASSPNFLNNPILGIYGCDTNHIQFSGCPSNPNQLQIVNYGGLNNVNILSWASTTMRIY